MALVVRGNRQGAARRKALGKVARELSRAEARAPMVEAAAAQAEGNSVVARVAAVLGADAAKRAIYKLF